MPDSTFFGGGLRVGFFHGRGRKDFEVLKRLGEAKQRAMKN